MRPTPSTPAVAPDEFYHCGACRALFLGRELRPGTGRAQFEHPEHLYAPCGCSQTWFGCTAAEVEPEPATGLEFFEPEAA